MNRLIALFLAILVTFSPIAAAQEEAATTAETTVETTAETTAETTVETTVETTIKTETTMPVETTTETTIKAGEATVETTTEPITIQPEPTTIEREETVIAPTPVEKPVMPPPIRCPEPPPKPECPPDHNMMSNVDSNGCIVSHQCVPIRTKPACIMVDVESERIRCEKNGGSPEIRKDPGGCVFVECMFKRPMEQSVSISPVTPIFGSSAECPTGEDVDEATRKCEESGMRSVIDFDRGCKVVKCLNEEFRERSIEEKCGYVSEPVRKMVEEKCRNMGFGVINKFDERGCPTIDCDKPEEECPKELPPEAMDRCNAEGGEMTVKNDESGCIVFSKCVRRGNEDDVYMDPIEDMPEPTKLLEVAFKLEDLRIELDKLARQSIDIADYYDSVDSPDSERFRRVADMFEAAKDRVDEIKTKLRERLRDLTMDDLMEVKHDIRYLKEVVITDIVYIMLSTSDEVNEMIRAKPMEEFEEEVVEGADCGSDGRCFDKAFRVCKSITFRPEGRQGPIVNIVGLQDEGCVLKAMMPEGQGPPAGMIPGINPPYEMTCYIKNYALGMKGPEDMLPYCEGSMAELMKKFGTGPPREAMTGPGGCRGDEECGKFCAKNPDECIKWCNEHPGFCPSQAEEKLQTLRAIKVIE